MISKFIKCIKLLFFKEVKINNYKIYIKKINLGRFEQLLDEIMLLCNLYGYKVNVNRYCCYDCRVVELTIYQESKTIYRVNLYLSFSCNLSQIEIEDILRKEKRIYKNKFEQSLIYLKNTI